REHFYLGHTLEALGIVCLRQGQQLSGWARSAQCGVVEEGNLSVRMEDSLQELRHGPNLMREQVRARKPLPCGCTQEPDFGQVFEDLGVIHRRALEVPAVGENLLVQFLLKQIFTLCPPSDTAGCLQKRSGKQQCLDVLQEVISQEVFFEPPFERCHLDDQALEQSVDFPPFYQSLQRLSVPGQKLQPIDDPKG